MRAERMPQILRRFVRVEGWEKTHWLSNVAPPAWTDEQGPAWRLGRIQRALGMIVGTPLEGDKITIGPKTYTLDLATKKSVFEDMKLGEENMLSIWPTFDEPWKSFKAEGPEWGTKIIHASGVRVECPHPNRVEVLGVLNHVWRSGFEVKLYTQGSKAFKYVRISGQYPSIDDINQLVYVLAEFDPETGTLNFISAHPVSFAKRPKAKSAPSEAAQSTSTDVAQTTEDVTEEE